MKQIASYIIEKLIINKDTKVEDLRKYIVTFGVSKGKGVLFRVDNSLEDIKAYIKRNNISKKDVYVFKFPLEVKNELLLQNELLDKCEDNYKGNISWAELILWCEKNNIGYIGRDYVFNESLIDEKLYINKDSKPEFIYNEISEIINPKYPEVNDYIKEWITSQNITSYKLYVPWRSIRKLNKLTPDIKTYHDIDRDGLRKTYNNVKENWHFIRNDAGLGFYEKNFAYTEKKYDDLIYIIGE